MITGTLAKSERVPASSMIPKAFFAIYLATAALDSLLTVELSIVV